MAQEEIKRQFEIYEDTVHTALEGFNEAIKNGICDDAYTWFLETYEFLNRCIGLASVSPELNSRLEQLKEKYRNAKRQLESMCKMKFVSPGSNPGVFVEVRFLKDTPMITGVDMKQYGPFRKGDVAALPKENARVLIKMKVAEKRVKPPTEPTLKEVMKGEVLTGYVEAARVVRVLGEEVLLAGEDTALLADLFLDLLTGAGVSLPSRFKGEFEKAMDIYKPYDENVELIEEAAHRIIKRETGEEYPVGEPLRRAREKVEKLLKEIREAQGE